jgi:hypothetical protein
MYGNNLPNNSFVGLHFLEEVKWYGNSSLQEKNASTMKVTV